jgi:ankyrin repeat protein
MILWESVFCVLSWKQVIVYLNIALATLYNLRGMTALHEAAVYGRIETVKYLAQRTGSGLIGRVDNDGRTALWIAANGGFRSMVDFLVGAGSAVDTAGHVGATPLSAAAERGYLDIVKYVKKILYFDTFCYNYNLKMQVLVRKGG